MSPLSYAELTQFGVVPEDEGPHAFDPEVEWWNESWFWDWFDADGSRAGHCRIGLHPNQERAWLWFYLYDGAREEWLALEATRLPLADVTLPELAYDRWGLRFRYRPAEPLQSGELEVEGFGRVVSGPRTGMVLPVGAKLEFLALGPPHSAGPAAAAGHSSERFPASRFEQPITVRGTLRVGDQEQPFAGRGERDHSWGPRHWNLEWNFMVLNREDMRLQCAEAVIPNVGRFPVGYLHREKSVSIPEVSFDLEHREHEVRNPFSGNFTLCAEDGTRLCGSLECISAAEIDITHTLVPPRRSTYRRALIRARLDDGSPPLLGWLEINRFN